VSCKKLNFYVKKMTLVPIVRWADKTAGKGRQCFTLSLSKCGGSIVLSSLLVTFGRLQKEQRKKNHILNFETFATYALPELLYSLMFIKTLKMTKILKKT